MISAAGRILLLFGVLLAPAAARATGIACDAPPELLEAGAALPATARAASNSAARRRRCPWHARRGGGQQHAEQQQDPAGGGDHVAVVEPGAVACKLAARGGSAFSRKRYQAPITPISDQRRQPGEIDRHLHRPPVVGFERQPAQEVQEDAGAEHGSPCVAHEQEGRRRARSQPVTVAGTAWPSR